MDFIPETSLLQFSPDSLQYVRKQRDLDNIDKLNDSLNTLYEWIQKQEHFKKKDYTKEYLERLMIRSNGSIEIAKKKFDILCTLKTKLPKYFEPFDMDNSYILKIAQCAFLPKMTKDHSRIFVLKNRGQHYDSGILDFFKYLMMIIEYSAAHDYTNGLIAIFDYTENNIKELSKAINLVELQEALTIIMEGYNIKVNDIHYLTSSKWIDTFVGLLKNVLSPSLGKIIRVHNNVESIYEYVPKNFLPVDYGGQEKPLNELSDKMLEVLRSNNFTKYYKEMKQAQINESLRKKDLYDDYYIGMPGSLKMMNID